MSVTSNRLASGYYNSQAVSLANPGGFAAGGHVTNFPAALVDIGVVVNEAAASAASAEAARVGSQAALVDINAGLAGALMKNDNLASVANAGTARNNLGLGAAQSVTFGMVSVADPPSSGNHLVNKTYADSLAAGMRIKPAARAASTANINLAAPGAAIDGVNMVAGEYFLAKDQTAPAENGLYVWNGAAVAATRAAEADTWAELPGAFVFVNEGTANADRGWVCTSNAGGTLGVTAVAWSQFMGNGAYQATSAALAAIAALSFVNNRMIYSTGAATFALATLSSFGRTYLGLADAAAARANLGVTTTEAVQNIRNADYTLALSDSGNHVYHSDATPRAWTVPPNSGVAFPIGTMITLVNDSSGAVTVTQGAGVAIIQAGSGAAGNRTLAQNGVATLIKVAAARWFISGAGLS